MMINYKIRTLCYLALLSALKTFANPSDFPPVTIPNTQVISLESSINNRAYQLQVALPSNYTQSNKRYPVVYLLDANNDFPLVTSMSRRLYQEDNLDPIIIVGISYKKNAYIHRAADYTPTMIGGERETGQANKFLQVFNKEVIPIVDKIYRTKPNDRTIAGHSLGALFGAYNIISNDNTFNRFIISSPSLWWDGFKTLSFAQSSYKKPVEVYLSVGSEEGNHMKNSATKLRTFIQKKRANAKLKNSILDGETHGSAKFRAYADGLKWLFKRSP